jgi:hypothetical protein
MKLTTGQPTAPQTADDRCAKLAAFITSHLPERIDCTGITLLARSAASPAAEAIVQLGPELAARRVHVRVVFTTLGPEGGSVDWSAATSGLPFTRDVRWASHPRFAEAHEQLVVAGEACWIGDCMRRDPGKRDVFERFAGTDVSALQFAAASFERIWSRAEPVAVQDARVTRSQPS